jgi:hypothetical protein
MKIENSVATDVDEIFRLYISLAYQKKNVVVWPDFEQTSPDGTNRKQTMETH